MKTVYVVLLALASVSKAQIPNLGFCPDYLPMADFDIERFLGKWYEAERYFQFSEVAARCVVTDYAKAPSGRIYVSNEVTNRLTGVKRVIGGSLELAGRAGEGKLHVKYSTTPISTDTILTVLDTDYDTYAVIWSCSGFGPIHAQSAWVMTRDRLPNGNVLQRAYGVLDKYRISRTFFVKTDQEGCALAASDINAANGITSTSTIAEATGTEQKSIQETKNVDSVPEKKEDKPVVPQQTIVQDEKPIKDEIKVEPAVKVEETVKEQREVQQSVAHEQLVSEQTKDTIKQEKVQNEIKTIEEPKPIVQVDELKIQEQPKTDSIPDQKVLTVAEVVLENSSQKQEIQKVEETISNNAVQDQVVEEAKVVQVGHAPDELIPNQKSASIVQDEVKH